MVKKKAATSKKRVSKKTAKTSAVKATKKTAKRVVRKPAAQVSPVAAAESALANSRIQLGKLYTKQQQQAEKSVERVKAQLDKAIAAQNAKREKKNSATEKLAEKRTTAAVNQAARARDALRTAGEKVTALRAELKAEKLAQGSAVLASKKFAAEEKALAKFESDWTKATTVKKRPAVKRRAAKARSKKAPEAAATESPVASTEE